MSRATAALLVTAGCAWTACARSNPPAPILNYHAIGPGPDYFTVSEPVFAQQLDWLASAGFRTISLADLVDGRGLDRGVVLTFDDGTDDALTRVLPALQKRGMRATFFIATSKVGTPGFLTWDGVRALAAAGMDIGSHTVSHAHLGDLPDDRVRAELAESKRELEAQVHRPVDSIAYPYNSVRSRIRDAAGEAGYRIGVSGVAHGSANRLDLKRFAITSATGLETFRRIVSSERAAKEHR